MAFLPVTLSVSVIDCYLPCETLSLEVCVYLGSLMQFHLNAYVNGSITKFDMLLLCILTYDFGKCESPS